MFGKVLKQKTGSLVGRPREFDRDAALLIAMKLFCKHGYEGVSVSELTRTIGVVPTSLYAAFGNKENLYRETLALNLRRRSLTHLQEDGPVREQILGLLQVAVRAATDPDFPGCMVSIGLLSCGVEHGALAEVVAELRARNCESIIDCLIRAVTRGELPVGTDALALGRYVVALMQGIAVQAHDGAKYEDLMAVVGIAMQSWPQSPHPSGTEPSPQSAR